jgi:FKBP-type peptidyl-prolyl cis-trans isomerase
MKVVYALFVVVALGVLTTIGYLAYKDSNKTKAKTAQIQSENDLNPKKTNQNNTMTLGVTNDSAPTQQSMPLNSGQQQTQANNNQLLEPSQFKTYDSYKTSDQMLIIDSVTGNGTSVVSGKKVAVLYKGWLTDGTVFDQSRPNENNELQPFVFTPGTGSVIAGWDQGILGMKVGGTRRLVIPPSAGYGEQGQGTIPPNAVLIFDIQLLEVEQ